MFVFEEGDSEIFVLKGAAFKGKLLSFLKKGPAAEATRLLGRLWYLLFHKICFLIILFKDSKRIKRKGV